MIQPDAFEPDQHQSTDHLFIGFNGADPSLLRLVVEASNTDDPTRFMIAATEQSAQNSATLIQRISDLQAIYEDLKATHHGSDIIAVFLRINRFVKHFSVMSRQHKVGHPLYLFHRVVVLF